jgi:hypothetical protein
MPKNIYMRGKHCSLSNCKLKQHTIKSTLKDAQEEEQEEYSGGSLMSISQPVPVADNLEQVRNALSSINLKSRKKVNNIKFNL